MSKQADNRDTLEEAFNAFNVQSILLESAYSELQGRVESLTAELAASQSARHRELLEKEALGERLARTLEALPGAVVVLDSDGYIRERNELAAELLNQPLLGRPWAEIVQREFAACGDADGELKLHDGRYLSLQRRRLGGGRGEILLLTDVTESRRMRELLARHERLSAVGEMSARLAHQIRTPLAAALLYASQLDSSDHIGGRIVERLQELDRTVRDMLQFAGGARSGDTIIDAEDLLYDVSETAIAAAGTDVLIRVDDVAADLVLHGNRDALKGALLNLVDNAINACGVDGCIELGALRDGDRICLTICDNGPGIPVDRRDRIFEPFFTTRPQGTGLGLAVVRSVAEAHGGEVLLDTGCGGTTFVVSVPAACKPPVSATRAAALAEVRYG